MLTVPERLLTASRGKSLASRRAEWYPGRFAALIENTGTEARTAGPVQVETARRVRQSLGTLVTMFWRGVL
jgi:hypothetical protein